METIDKATLHTLTDAELFKALKTCGLPAGPITGSTRSIYEKRLKSNLEKYSTVTMEKTTAKPAAACRIPVIETLTSTAFSDKSTTLSSTVNPQVSLTNSKSQSAPHATILNINIHNNNTAPKSSRLSDTQLEPKIPSEKHAASTKPFSSMVEPSKQRLHTDQQVTPNVNVFDRMSSGQVLNPSARENTSYGQKSGPFHEFKKHATPELPVQRTSSLVESSSLRSTYDLVERSEKQNFQSQTTYQVLRGSVTSQSDTIVKPSIDNLISKTSDAEASTTRYDNISKHIFPQLAPNIFSSSIVTHRLTPLAVDKYGDRCNNYGLLDPSTFPKASPSSTAAATISTYSITPNTIRARPGLHTPKPRESNYRIDTGSVPSSTVDSKVNSKEESSEKFNVKYAIALVLVIVFIYWIMVNKFQSNPENPLD